MIRVQNGGSAVLFLREYFGLAKGDWAAAHVIHEEVIHDPYRTP